MRISLKNLKILIENYILEQEAPESNDESEDETKLDKIKIEVSNFLNKDFTYLLEVNPENENFKLKISGSKISISEGSDIEDNKKLAYVGLGLLYADDKEKIKKLLEAGKIFGLKTEISENEIDNLFNLRQDKNKASFSINNTYFKGSNEILSISNKIIEKLNS